MAAIRNTKPKVNFSIRNKDFKSPETIILITFPPILSLHFVLT